MRRSKSYRGKRSGKKKNARTEKLCGEASERRKEVTRRLGRLSLRGSRLKGEEKKASVKNAK